MRSSRTEGEPASKATNELVSVVVPLLNEEKSVRPLVDSVRDALSDVPRWELILVDDGSTDATRRIASEISGQDPRIRILVLARNYGQSTAMQAGFDHARGDVVVTMDGDLQNDPRDIPRVLDKLREGYDLVAGYRTKRQDSFLTRKVPSWIANKIIAWMTGVEIRDNGCSLKAYRKALLGRMRLYSEMHRFIPALAASTGGARIAEVDVRHHARAFGESKYGLSRVFRVLADLFTIKMIRSFRLRPLAMFASLAGLSALLGAAFMVSALVTSLSFESVETVSVVFPAIGLLWFALAVFLLMLGLVGEVVIRQWAEPRRIPPILRDSTTQ